MQAEFGVLGPLLVRSGPAVLRVPAARQRVVLAALAVRPRQAVSSHELAAVIWDSTPPARPQLAVRNYVSRLRKALGPAGGRIVTRAPGYLLDAADDEVDLLAFTRLCRRGGAAVRAAAWPQASDLLDEALRLWRGTPLADIPSAVLRDEHVPVLESQRLQATEWRLEAGLHLGRHRELIPELTALAREQPLRERFHAQLMLALYRSGRRGEALAAYHRVRGVLVAELGVEPGPDLQRLHRRILATDPGLLLTAPAGAPARPGSPGQPWMNPDVTARAPESAALPPHQLPAALRHFAGRTDELTALDGLLDGAGRPPGAVVIAAIGGMPGIGKTALAVHWAHRAAGEFPDGQLYVNLRGFDPSGPPVTPAEAVCDFLGALGTPPERIPARPQAQAALYRSLVTGKRLLIVLDNARDADQVRPLLPGSPGCLVLVTSRAALAGLAAAEGAHLLILDRPSESEARDLLAGRLGTGPVAEEPEAADELVALCARLPLALSIAAARAAACPRFPLAALAAELRDAAGRLEALDAGNAASCVRSVFSWSYRQLSPAAARMFRLLGVHPGPDISAPAAASLAGLPPPQARTALRELVHASLLAEPAPGRHALHDLLRIYAAEQAGACDSSEERHAATTRMLDHYLRTGYAVAALYPTCFVLTLPPATPPGPGVIPEELGNHRQALAWFRAEHKVLIAAIARAADGFDRHAMQIPLMLRPFLNLMGYRQDSVATGGVAIAAACRLRDTAGEAHARCHLGSTYISLGAYQEADAQLREALALYQRTGCPRGQGIAHGVMASMLERQHRHADALHHAEEALEQYRIAGYQLGEASALNSIGWCHAKLGNAPRALPILRQALELHQAAGESTGLARTWDSLGYAHYLLGRHEQAITCYQRANVLSRKTADRPLRADVLIRLGDAHAAAGDAGASRDAREQALALLADLYHPDTERVRAKLRAPGIGAARRGP